MVTRCDLINLTRPTPFISQRFPGREAHGLATEDKAGIETTGDKDAMLYYHKIGTPQCQSVHTLAEFQISLLNPSSTRGMASST